MSDGTATERRRDDAALLQTLLDEQAETRRIVREENAATRTMVAALSAEIAKVPVALKERELYQRLTDQEVERLRIEVEGKDGDTGIKQEVKSLTHRVMMAAGAVAVILWGLDHLAR